MIRSNFDFINITNSKTTVVFKPAIFAALIGQKGLINNHRLVLVFLSVHKVWRKQERTAKRALWRAHCEESTVAWRLDPF